MGAQKGGASWPCPVKGSASEFGTDQLDASMTSLEREESGTDI